jgi:hypothetical protein
LKKNGFKVSEIVQTLTDINSHEVEQPLNGSGKGSFVVVNARKK